MTSKIFFSFSRSNPLLSLILFLLLTSSEMQGVKADSYVLGVFVCIWTVVRSSPPSSGQCYVLQKHWTSLQSLGFPWWVQNCNADICVKIQWMDTSIRNWGGEAEWCFKYFYNIILTQKKEIVQVSRSHLTITIQ